MFGAGVDAQHYRSVEPRRRAGAQAVVSTGDCSCVGVGRSFRQPPASEDGRRKVHARTTALGGGLAIFAATTVAVVYALTASPLGQALAQSAGWLSGLFAASMVISFVGLADDRCHLRGKYKLLGQFVAAG